MADRDNSYNTGTTSDIAELDRFTESYAKFNRIINSLQRQYIELKDEFSRQNAELAETNRKLVEMTRSNLQATEFLNSILESMGAGVIAVDSRGIITHFNPAASTMLGIPDREPCGDFYSEVIPDAEPHEATAMHAIECGQVVESVEKRVELPDGSRLYVSTTTNIIQTDDGRIRGAVEVFHDLTKIKKMETEIARLNTLAQLGEMAATIAHQVRNPLAGIGGFASLLRRDLPEDDPRRQTVDKIIRGVESLNTTVTSLLGYTRSEELQREEVELYPFIQNLVAQFMAEHEEAIGETELRMLSPDGHSASEVRVQVDPQLCRELLTNVLMNAIEACCGSGEVAVNCRKLPRQSATRDYGDRLLLDMHETVIEVTITDSGPGVPEDKLDDIFSPFFTTKSGGIGLGLAVCAKIARAHGGDMIAENQPQGGAVFRLLLPVRMDG